MSFFTIDWRDDKVVMLNQLLLPQEERYDEYDDHLQVASAIQRLVIRGAPAIGIAAAMGVAIGALRLKTEGYGEFRAGIDRICDDLAATRPTAINLFWALERMKALVASMEGSTLDEIREALVAEGKTVLEEDIRFCRKLGEHGADLVRDGDTILTHCNAGALATGGWGTATAVIRVAHEQGKKIKVLADETRPFLQGARLTAWELHRDGIPVEIIGDSMAGHFLKAGKVDLAVVGTDRTVANGDVANKIGTYTVALAANANDVPFYVAAPTSSIDMSIPSGDGIPIEERSADEMTSIGDTKFAPEGVVARYVAFDVTPNRLVTAIITEKGIASPPYWRSLPRFVSRRSWS